ncbi:MAG TPA: AAA family ATPase [Bryobacteraceae bacterium]|nr:AAA family ATPase [Bryobacteraceae bacterium]
MRELGSYGGATGLVAVLDMACDAIVVEIDSNVASALELVERISQNSSATVMVFSASTDPEVLVRCMRAGAREFLRAANFTSGLGEALARARARRAEPAGDGSARGRLLVFWGAKGGVGVTTLASNFALALRNEAKAEVALVDLNLQLGGVAVLLGVNPRFTVLDALRHGDRLDGEFVSTLMTQHASGLSVLASSDEYVPSVPIENGTLGKVFHILRQRYRYVVVDAGPGLGASTEELFEAADCTYVVTQLDIPSLRNAQRFLAHHRRAGQQGMEVVLNRFEPRKLEYDEDRISKALGISPKWKIPNDYPGVRRSQNTGTPLVLANSSVARGIAEMARAACGKQPARREKSARSGFLGLAW